MVLVERGAPLAALQEYAEQARAGSGRLVLVTGEAGAGKTALVEAAQARISARWMWGYCEPLSTPRPLGPWRDVAPDLDPALARLWQPDLARDDIFHAVLAALADGPQLRVVVLEDVHWADDATLDLLRFLCRRLGSLHALIVATYRDDEHSPRLFDAVADLDPIRVARRIDVPRLSAAAVAQLADGSGRDVVALHRVTGGNPFFVHELLRAAPDETAPASVRALVLARAGRLQARARRLLDVLALSGPRTAPDVLVASDGADADLLDDLLESGLVVCDAAGFSFAHEVARVAVDQAVAPHRRIGLHRGILAALLGAPDPDVARIARHAAAAGDAATTLEYARRAAAEAAAMGSHREALQHLRNAAQHADRLPPADRAQLWDDLGATAAVLDDAEAALHAFRTAATLWRSQGDTTREGGSLTQSAAALLRSAQGSAATAVAEQALTQLDAGPATAERARALAFLATDRMVGGRSDEAVQLAERAARLADELGLDAVRSDALNTLSASLLALERDWRPTMRAAIDLARAAGAHLQVGRGYVNLVFGLMAEFRLGEAEAAYTEGRAYCDAHDVRTYGRCLRGDHGELLDLSGRWDEALSESQAALARGPAELNRYLPLAVSGRIRLRQGDASGRGQLEEAARIARASGQPQYLVQSAADRAEAHWLAGDDDAARAAAAEARRHLPAVPTGVRGPAAVWLHRLAGIRVHGVAPAAVAAELRGDRAAAAAWWDAAGCRYLASLALAFGDGPAQLREAVIRLDAGGAPAAADAVRARMRRLGHRPIPIGPRAATRAHPVGLTPREHQVLELLGQSLTNAQIAGRLVVSPRTVDRHVSSVLVKLDVPSRHHAVAAGRAAGLLDS